MSLVQTRLGTLTANCRPKRFGATGRLCFESVVALYFFLAFALMPCSAMSFLTRSLPTRIPLASSSFHIRGQPYSPFTWAWIALICTSSASLLTRFRCCGLASRRQCAWYPLGLTQHFALHRHRPVPLVPLDPGVLHSDSFAKYAVAFFRMSRSIFTRASSARNRLISICSGLTGLAAVPFSSPLPRPSPSYAASEPPPPAPATPPLRSGPRAPAEPLRS